MSVKKFALEAKAFMAEAKSELERGLKEDKPVVVRDAAEKAWNAVVQILNAATKHYLGTTARSHYERRRMLRELESRAPEVERLGLYDRYMARQRGLHGEVFYEGTVDEELMLIEMEKAEKLIKDVEELLKTKDTA